MIIYADILFLLNLFITYILLVLTAVILKSPLKRLRFLLAALIGAAYALSILIEIHFLLGTALKIAACALIILSAFGKLNLRAFFSHVVIFLALNVTFGGLVMLISKFDSRNFYSNIYIAYINITPLHFIIALSVSYIAVNFISRLILRKRAATRIYTVILFYEGQQYRLSGFCDTGNDLCEPFSAAPVSLVKSGKIKAMDKAPLPRIVPFSSLGGDGILLAVKMRMRIEYRHKLILEKEAYIAQSSDAFKDMQYDIILNPKLFAETEHL